MNTVLLINATEELQTLAEELLSAGFEVDACPLEDAGGRISGGARVEAVLVNLMDQQASSAIRELGQAEAFPPHTAVICLLRAQQLAELDPASPIDDFIVHPVAAEELVARLRRSVQRKGGEEGPHILHCGDLTIDQAGYKVFLAGRPVDLTYKEYELLRFLASNQDKVCTREMLLSRVWGYDFYGGARTVDVHIRRLRTKIEDRNHTFIETVRNVGYRFHAS